AVGCSFDRFPVGDIGWDGESLSTPVLNFAPGGIQPILPASEDGDVAAVACEFAHCRSSDAGGSPCHNHCFGVAVSHRVRSTFHPGTIVVERACSRMSPRI